MAETIQGSDFSDAFVEWVGVVPIMAEETLLIRLAVSQANRVPPFSFCLLRQTHCSTDLVIPGSGERE
jgi:hypothetical protein